MDAPKFNLGQRVYNRANPYHGKVVEIFTTIGIHGWVYTLLLDLPNPSNQSRAYYGEGGLRATLEETLEWQKAQGPDWKCLKCPNNNLFLKPTCELCGAARPSSEGGLI